MNYFKISLLTLMVTAGACRQETRMGSDDLGDRKDDKDENSTEETHKVKTAEAEISSASGSNMQGLATFTETKDDKVVMHLRVSNATPGAHAIHLHETGDCSAEDASSAGEHWNPGMEGHGDRMKGNVYHRGDIGNIMVGDDGTGTFEMTADDWTIGGDSRTSIIDKAVIIHKEADDFISQPSGASGARVGCGVIREIADSHLPAKAADQDASGQY